MPVMRNALDAALKEIGAVDDGNRWPDELRGVQKTRRVFALIRKYVGQVIDEMDDLRTMIIEEQAKSGTLRDENTRLRDRLAKTEFELIQLKLRQRLEHMEIPEADRVKILECTK